MKNKNTENLGDIIINNMEEISVALKKDGTKSKKLTVRTVVRPAPPKELTPKQIAMLRKKMNISQNLFAELLNVSIKTVQAWEGGFTHPSGPALRLLNIAQRDPKQFIYGVTA